MTNADTEHLFIHPDPYKKICAAIRAMDTEEEARRVAGRGRIWGRRCLMSYDN